MGRRKKFNNVHSEHKEESHMHESNVAVLEPEASQEIVINEEAEALKDEILKLKIELENAKKPVTILEPSKSAMTTIIPDKTKQSIVDQNKAYDSVKVTGKFINRRAPGNGVKLLYQKYAENPVKWYEFQDGKVYTIDRGFADQINNHYYRPAFIQKQGDMHPDAPTSAILEVDDSNKLYSFVPINF